MTQLELAKLAGISLRSFTDWRREKASLPFPTAQLFSRKSGISFPKNAKTLNRYWYTKKAGAAGAQAVLKKYGRLGGNADNWKRKWLNWWERKGRFLDCSPVGRSKSFRKPKRSSELAEFIGIVLGDGGISKTQICITLHSIDDRAYSNYVEKLIKRLFNVTAGRHKYKNALAESLFISRTELVKWFGKVHGLKIGSKVRQQADVPTWTKNDTAFSKACVRGLVDTDGSVFLHKYKVAGKMYEYKKLSFTNASRPLIFFVYETLSKLGLRARLAWKDGEEREVRLDSKSDMKKYFDLIGTHNPKFLKRWRE
ncbi:MAG: LAGLIDADG family homing endonuclease [bacterium]|nr:LAGLIDADG family homing endonuclease [bacterium]